MSSAASFYELEAEKPKGDKIKFEVRHRLLHAVARSSLKQRESPRGDEEGGCLFLLGRPRRTSTDSL